MNRGNASIILFQVSCQLEKLISNILSSLSNFPDFKIFFPIFSAATPPSLCVASPYTFYYTVHTTHHPHAAAAIWCGLCVRDQAPALKCFRVRGERTPVWLTIFAKWKRYYVCASVNVCCYTAHYAHVISIFRMWYIVVRIMIYGDDVRRICNVTPQSHTHKYTEPAREDYKH